MYTYQNPVITGFNPDPSICRVDNDFYLVTSTMEFFPGVPLYHSRNLANWQLTGHCLTTEKQNPLRGCGTSMGIYAPTIRHHQGTFFMTSTNVASIRNFIVHTQNPADGWSDPVPVAQTGIDPSLFFDEDGKVYYTSTAVDEAGVDCIQMSEIDPITGELHTSPRIISHGTGGCYPEAPHLYRKDGYYYLLLAEGGTEYGHKATIQRSKSIYGPYTPAPHNPILHHQHRLGHTPIQAVGHADFVEDQNGNWWAVCLGIRPVPYGLLHNLGREVFLAPVAWDAEGWPHIGDAGMVSLTMQGPLPGEPRPPQASFADGFDAPELAPEWTFIRNPEADCFSLTEKPGCVVLRGNASLSQPYVSPGFIGVRQKAYKMKTSALLCGPLQEGQKAGLCVFYNNDQHYEIYLQRLDSRYAVAVNRRLHDLEAETFRQEIEYPGHLRLEVSGDERAYHFGWQAEGGPLEDAGQGALAGLCTESAGGITFTGTFIGLFTQGGPTAFDHFEMTNL